MQNRLLDIVRTLTRALIALICWIKRLATTILLSDWVSGSESGSEVNGRPLPGPYRWPLVGNLNLLTSAEPRQMFIDLTKKHGPIFVIGVGPVDLVCLTKYDVIKEALIKQGENFAGRPRFHAMGATVRGYHGLVMTEKQQWQEQRRFAIQTLKDFGFGRAVMEDKINAEIDNLINDLDSRLDQPIDLSLPLQFCVGNILASIIFGRTFAHDDQEFIQFKELLEENFKAIVSFGAAIWETFPSLTKVPILRKLLGFEKVLQQDRELSAFLQRRLDECRQRYENGTEDDQEQPSDFATAFWKEMLRRRALDDDDDDDNSQFYTERQWLAVVNDLWIAGMETTVVVLRWALLFLILHPEVQLTVRKEINATIGDERRPVMADKRLMPYTVATLHECIRLANIVPYNLLHKVHRDAELSGYRIPAGSWIMPQISAVLWDPDVFPEPRQFRPERFLQQDSLRKVQEFVPFSVGKRSCIGENLANMELFLIVVSLLQRYEIVGVDDQTLSTDGIVGLTMSPMPYRCRLRLIRQQH